jgi:hypothetical protein
MRDRDRDRLKSSIWEELVSRVPYAVTINDKSQTGAWHRVFRDRTGIMDNGLLLEYSWKADEREGEAPCSWSLAERVVTVRRQCLLRISRSLGHLSV